MKILLSGLCGLWVGLILLWCLGGCANESLMTPKGCEAWVNMHVPKEFSCYPRAEFCRAHLDQHGWFTKTVIVDNGTHAIVECRDKFGKATVIFN